MAIADCAQAGGEEGIDCPALGRWGEIPCRESAQKNDEATVTTTKGKGT